MTAHMPPSTRYARCNEISTPLTTGVSECVGPSQKGCMEHALFAVSEAPSAGAGGGVRTRHPCQACTCDRQPPCQDPCHEKWANRAPCPDQVVSTWLRSPGSCRLTRGYLCVHMPPNCAVSPTETACVRLVPRPRCGGVMVSAGFTRVRHDRAACHPFCPLMQEVVTFPACQWFLCWWGLG